MKFDVDIAIVVGFLVATLAVGLGHGQKVKNIKDYALGGRNFSTGTLVATIVATWISGSMFFTDLSHTYSDGLIYVIPALGFAFAFVIISVVLVPRMEEFMGKTSIAEAMGDLYGQKVRIIIAIAGVIGSAGSIAVQFKVFGNIFSYFFDISSIYAIITAGIAATLYSAFGGIRAVTFTDVLQFLTFGFILPLIGILVWNHTYGVDFSLSAALKSPKFNYREVLTMNNPDFWGMIALLLYFAIPSLKSA